MMAVFCGVTALAGHLWPVYLDFKGGKGVATAAGIVFALNWMAGAIAFAVWLLVFLPARYVSLASVAAAAALPFAHFFTRARFWQAGMHWPVTIFCVVAALVVIVKHRDNLARLKRGEEKKFNFRKDPAAVAEPK
jgi:glycerol-3-phosphate acyltransferase PlsY